MNWLDRFVGWWSPEAGVKRSSARRALELSNGYRNARRGRLDSSRGVTATPDAHLELDRNRRSLVERSRELQRNNAFADGILTRSTENVIGCGIRPQARSASESWNKQAEELFAMWAMEGSDVRGMSTFWELQRLVYRSLISDGDVGLVLRPDGSLQVVTSPQIASPLGKENEPLMRDGVELNEAGRPIQYHVVSSTHRLMLSDPRALAQRTIVQAKDMIFLSRRQSADQTRGLSVFSQTEDLFEHLDKLIEAVVVASRMAACFGMVITSPFGADNSKLQTGVGSDGVAYPLDTIEPGMVKYLNEGETMDQVAPQQPRQDFPDFMVSLVRLLGLQLGLPLELVFLDFSRTNYSSARAALLQAYRAFECQQQFLTDHFLQRVWKWQISRFVAAGELGPRPDGLVPDWVPPPNRMIDPLKELQAHHLGIDIGTENLSEVLRSQGKDFSDMVAKRRAELDALEEAGIPVKNSALTRDAVDRSAEPGAPPPPVDEEDPEGEDQDDDSDPDSEEE